ncbi:MAG: hypothetical protein Q8N18_17510 [Opitutaceae bacterium]|nr:hypothetical protein [Opitutaceae bacterium]
MSEIEQLSQLCERLGSARAQAATMAAQLLKRADQLAAERGTTREAALAGLIEVLVKGRAGDVPARFAPPPRPDDGK